MGTKGQNHLLGLALSPEKWKKFREIFVFVLISLIFCKLQKMIWQNPKLHWSFSRKISKIARNSSLPNSSPKLITISPGNHLLVKGFSSHFTGEVGLHVAHVANVGLALHPVHEVLFDRLPAHVKFSPKNCFCCPNS